MDANFTSESETVDHRSDLPRAEKRAHQRPTGLREAGTQELVLEPRSGGSGEGETNRHRQHGRY